MSVQYFMDWRPVAVAPLSVQVEQHLTESEIKKLNNRLGSNDFKLIAGAVRTDGLFIFAIHIQTTHFDTAIYLRAADFSYEIKKLFGHHHTFHSASLRDPISIEDPLDSKAVVDKYDYDSVSTIIGACLGEGGLFQELEIRESTKKIENLNAMRRDVIEPTSKNAIQFLRERFSEHRDKVIRRLNQTGNIAAKPTRLTRILKPQWSIILISSFMAGLLYIPHICIEGEGWIYAVLHYLREISFDQPILYLIICLATLIFFSYFLLYKPLVLSPYLEKNRRMSRAGGLTRAVGELTYLLPFFDVSDNLLKKNNYDNERIIQSNINFFAKPIECLIEENKIKTDDLFQSLRLTVSGISIAIGTIGIMVAIVRIFHVHT